MNILIVDDEISAVQGIIKIIDWGKLGIANTYTAYSMPEAIECFLSHDIELLLTDIEMRGDTGFDLIRWANERTTRHVSIILSAFPNFTYAQSAIRLGVFEYLLKPVSESQLELALARSADYLKKTRKFPDPAEQATVNPLIERAKNYIIEHISQEINRNDLANYLGFSPSYLSILFKKETGNTLSDYIKEERIAFAKRLLKQTNLPIGVISENVGYESLAYFSSVFRQHVGYTPREYRNNSIKRISV
jgi:YesN/AraC family two-component response regulator